MVERQSSKVGLLAWWSVLLAVGILAKDDLPPKRGLTYIRNDDPHNGDYDILLSEKSPLTWYFTWSPIPAPRDTFPKGAESRVEFVPTLPSTDNLDDNVKALDRVPKSSEHLFTFNEPDGTTDSGGSSITPEDAAKAYIEKIVPLRERFLISHPSVTGSSRGLDWLDDFNSSCWDIDADNGCPADFVVAHWYGPFEGLVSWLDQLSGWYNQSGSSIEKDVKIWVSELGLAQADSDTTFDMMKRTLPYLDQLDDVEKYAWFGVFRPKEANSWTGDSLALFENDGGLSELGAYYLGGEENGFKPGQQGQPSGGNGNNSGNGGNGDDDDDDDDDGDANGAIGLRTSLWILFFVFCMIWIL
ncbi:glycosyl hydrolase catalytic core-domain-containing protein [Poronia punctata]|nr:glycosyl hydrolase catalytic core-domain-containing protein [Poronia punctata]